MNPCGARAKPGAPRPLRLRGAEALVILLAVSTAASAAEQPFAQFTSRRYLLSAGSAAASPPSTTPPWPTLPLGAVRQLAAAAAPRVCERGATVGAGAAVVALTHTGALFAVHPAGADNGTASVVPLSGMAARGPGTRIGTFRDGGTGRGGGGKPLQGLVGVVSCSAAGCSWHSCDLTVGSCSVLGVLDKAIGNVTAMVVDSASGDAWLHGSSTGLVRMSLSPSPSAEPFGQNVRGNVTALALHERGAADGCALEEVTSEGPPFLAVATDLAIYRGLREDTMEFATHHLIGGVIDSTPTSIAFLPAAVVTGRGAEPGKVDLWIGHRYCLNVSAAVSAIALKRVIGSPPVAPGRPRSPPGRPRPPPVSVADFRFVWA